MSATATIGTCCGEALVATNLDESVWEAKCDVCGASWGLPRHRGDNVIARQLRVEQAGFPPGMIGREFEQTDANKSTLFTLRGWLRDYGAWSRELRACKHADRKPKPPASPAVWGEQGRGKTHLLVMLSARLIDEFDVAVMFRSTRQLLRELQQFERPADCERTWQRAIGVDVLVLDDLGAHRATDWRDDQLADVIDERSQRELPLLIATNFPPAMWEQMVDLRTHSRLRGVTFPIELRGPDRRQLAIDQPAS